jgi:hypothetical protein
MSQLATATPVFLAERAARDGAVSVDDQRAGTCHAANLFARPAAPFAIEPHRRECLVE